MPLLDRVRQAVDAPWKARNELRRLLLVPVARTAMCLHGIRWRSGWKLYGLPIVQRHAGSTIDVGSNLDLRSWSRSNPLAPNHPVVLSTRRRRSRIRIGSDFAMTGGVLCADTAIEIGDRVAIGANCLIVDSDFHPLSPADRIMRPNEGLSSPIVIESDVFIGANTIVLKGVTIGAGSIIGAGSVVTRSLPPLSIAAGNPARFIRSLDPERPAQDVGHSPADAVVQAATGSR